MFEIAATWKVYEKPGTGFAIGLLLLGFIFYLILAWGDAQYQPQPA
ncbi:MAG: hypothetical protein ACREMC_04790 [Gemmatimonadales bacterium]